MSADIRNLLIAVCCLLAASSGQAHLLAPEQMFMRMDNANQAFMLYLTPPMAALASFDSDADGVLSAEEVDAQRQQIEQFLDQRLGFSFDGRELRRVFSDIASSASADHDHNQLTIVRRYVAEQVLPGLKIDYGLVATNESQQAASGIRAVLRPVDADAAEIFTVGADGAASTHEIVWDAENYYRASTWYFVLASAAVSLVTAAWWLLRIRARRSRADQTNTINNKSSSAGFSLIEVMVALVVAAISLSALSLALSRQANQQIVMRESVWGQVVAMNALVEMGAGTGEVFASNGGSEKLLNQEWDWQARASESSEASIDVIEVQALLEDNTVATMTGYLFIPERLTE